VLDVGCGEGTFTAALCRPGREVVAFDLAKAGVRLAARRLGPVRTRTVIFPRADCLFRLEVTR